MPLFDIFRRQPPVRPASFPFTPQDRRWLVQRPSAFIYEDNIIVAPRFADRDRMKLLPNGKYDGRTQTWSFPASETQALSIRNTFMDALTESPEFTHLADLAREQSLAPVDDSRPIPIKKTEEWPWQRTAFWFGIEREAVLFDMGMGTGKSKVFADLISNRAAKVVLIICPVNVMEVWPKQIQSHAGLTYEVVKLNEGSVSAKAEYARRLVEWVRSNEKRIIIIINYESAWRPPFGPTRNAKSHIIDRGFALSTKWDAIALDESHRVKSPSGQASRFVRLLRRSSPFRVCMTGTPMPHSPLDIWAQFAFLDPTIFGESYGTFRNKIAEMGGYGEREVKKWINQQWLADQIARITFHVGREVLDLYPSQHNIRTCKLSPKARTTYKELEAAFYAEVSEYVNSWDRTGDEKVTIANVLVKLLRCQQITSGYVRDDEGRDIQIDTSKRDLLEDVLEDIPPSEPVVVFARFQHDLEQIRAVAKKLDRRYKELSGRAKDLGPDATFPGECDVFGVQVQSGGVGIDLTKSRYGIYYSLDRSLGNYDQTLARQDRPGQDGRVEAGQHIGVTYYHLIVEDSIDQKIYDALDQRRDLIEALTELIKRDRKGEPASRKYDTRSQEFDVVDAIPDDEFAF